MASNSAQASLAVAPGSFISPVFNVDNIINGHKLEFFNGLGIRSVKLQHKRQALSIRPMLTIRWQGVYQKAQLTFLSAETARRAARYIVYKTEKPGNPEPGRIRLSDCTVTVESRHETVLTTLEMEYEGLQTWETTDIYDGLDTVVPKLRSLLVEQEPGVTQYLMIEMSKEEGNPLIQVQFRDEAAYAKYGQLVRDKADATLTYPVFSLALRVHLEIKAPGSYKDFVSRTSHIRNTSQSAEDVKLIFANELNGPNSNLKPLVIIGEKAAVSHFKKTIEKEFVPQTLLGGLFYATSAGYQQLLTTNLLASARVRVEVHGTNPFTTPLAKSLFKGSDTRLLDGIKAALRVLDNKCSGCQEQGMKLDWCYHAYCPECLSKQVAEAQKWPICCAFCRDIHARPIMLNTMSMLLTEQAFRRGAERALTYHAAQRPDAFLRCPVESCDGLLHIGPLTGEIAFCDSCFGEICVVCRQSRKVSCAEHKSKTASGKSSRKG